MSDVLKDIRSVASFIEGWWPGLEDAIPWGDDDAIDSDPTLLAAKRLNALSKDPPALLRALVAQVGGVEVDVDRAEAGGFLRIASDLSDFPAGPALLLPMEGSE